MAEGKGKANKGSGPENMQARRENPFVHIPFHRPDLTSSQQQGGGAKELVPVDGAYRRRLVETLDTAQASLALDLKFHPNALGVLIFKLRATGIAKSHRPITLAQESELLPAGHASVDEMLVGAHAASIAQLRWSILNRTTKQVRANLSAIIKIMPWSIERRVPQGLDSLRDNGPILIRPFRYQESDATARNLSALSDLLAKLNISSKLIKMDYGSVPLIRIADIDSVSDDDLFHLLSFPGIRVASTEPRYATPQAEVIDARRPRISLPSPSSDLPTVGVFDTGVSTRATSLNQWIRATETFVLPPDTDHVHGTMVASLVAGARILNESHDWFPPIGCWVIDVSGLETNSSYISDLIERLKTTIPKYPAVKVWNLSLSSDECDPDLFSEFAQALDEMSDRYGVLFVVAAGNYTSLPRRSWPAASTLTDRVGSPGDSVRSLTVGSIAHISAVGAMVEAGDPAPYSRRGPGPVFTPKPDIVHAGGGVHSPWNSGPASVQALSPTDMPIQTFGTSFAAPIVSAIAAHTWSALEGRKGTPPKPAMVKALLIHAAQLGSPQYSALERRYFGAGRPSDTINTLYDSDDSFTLAFEALVFPGMRWRKSPYPIPACLLEDGKFRGEVIITAVYSPPLDPNAGSEYVRANVEVSFGVLEGDRIKGRVPMDSDEGQSGFESLQVEHGAKWAPVKVHRKRFPNGTAGDSWALQAGVTLRAYEPPLSQALPVTILVTLRSITGDINVHADGLRALQQTNWVREQLPARIPVFV
ncbi:S8 family anti-phage peptidase IteS [Achromobacter xylosoxidans]|uniref:S8 family anti-phage peptidase IteS n=1 Tax=Alcaligenes xylosoxydans xylosoxydans TaxID=85698 RepID=UPI003D2756B8